MKKVEVGEIEDPYFDVKMPLVPKLFKNRLKAAVQIANISDDSSILDVGCHRGHLLKLIRNICPSCELHGIDISDYGVLNPVIDCDLQIADVRNIPFGSEYFDKVFATDSLEHVEEIDKAIDEIRRVLKKNGEFILTGPTETWFYQLCRFLWLGRFHYEGHKHTVYDLENKFESNGFKLVEHKSLPGFPFPELFSITKFKKI